MRGDYYQGKGRVGMRGGGAVTEEGEGENEIRENGVDMEEGMNNVMRGRGWRGEKREEERVKRAGRKITGERDCGGEEETQK